ncbi:MAG TPA: caspase family protein [Thermoanaerobaculia bacterium]|jgi:hypothetical protein|nr:caspase family protein [Thermoanaerobaculia bacterium]
MGKNDFAIVVGIGKYFDSNLPELNGPENDANAFYDWVTSSKGGDVPKDRAFRLLSSDFHPPFAALTDAKPTVKEIVKLFDEIRAVADANANKGKGYRAGERIYLFFAGHGFAPSHRQDQTALLVADADTATAQLAHILGTYMADSLYQARLFDEIFLFMDCCRSSSECSQLFMPYADEQAEEYWKVRRFYAYGARAGKEAREREFGGKVHGIFTRTLLDGLEGAAYDPDERGKITGESLQNLLYNAYPTHMDPQLRDDPTIPTEPEVVYERKPQEKLIVGAVTGMFGRLTDTRPKYAVRVRTSAHKDKVGHVLDRELRPAARVELAAETNVELERGLYALFVPGAPPKHFEVTGASGVVDVDLDERQTVKLTVTAADAATELYVIDGKFDLLSRGIGTAVFDVAPGIYKIKARAGIQQEERVVVVSDETFVTFGPLVFASPVPLGDTVGTTAELIATAQTLVAQPTIDGSGSSSIAVMVTGSARELRLLRADQLIATFDRALHVKLDPGGYILSSTLRDGRRVEQSLVTCAGWQTRVFIADTPDTTAILMRREGTPFDPDDADARLEEIARQALVHGRKVLSEEFLQRLAAPDVAPMLGIMGMHLLIREAKRNKLAREERRETKEVNHIADVQRIIAHLRAAIGRHPDVEAIAIGAGVAEGYEFTAPPMLTLSWRLLLKATTQRPELLPRESFADRIAMRLWGENAWLQWLDPATDRGDREAAALETLKLALLRLDTSDTPLAAGATERDFGRLLKDFVPKFMKSAELRAASAAPRELDFARVRDKIDATVKRKLVKQLGVPMASLEAMLESFEAPLVSEA